LSDERSTPPEWWPESINLDQPDGVRLTLNIQPQEPFDNLVPAKPGGVLIDVNLGGASGDIITGTFVLSQRQISNVIMSLAGAAKAARDDAALAAYKRGRDGKQPTGEPA